MKYLSISFIVATANICLAAKLDFNPVQTKESLSPSYDPSSTSLDSPSPSFETPYLSKEPLPRRVDSLSPYLPKPHRIYGSPEESLYEIPSKEPLPSYAKEPLPSFAKEPLPSYEKAALPSYEKAALPSYEKAALPSFEKAALPSYGIPSEEAYISRSQNVEDLSGTGSLDIYKNFNWTTARPSSSLDLELLQTWNNSEWRILDLVLIMDCTGSMSAWIEHSKTTLKSVIDDIVKENENLKVRVAFVGFRDFGDGDIIFSVQDFTFDIPTVKNFISKQRATGGGDLAEDVTGGLYQTLQLSWYPNSVRLASIIADAPTHGKQYHDISRDDYPEGSPAGVTLENLVDDFKKREIALTLYKLTDETEKMYDVIKDTYDSEDFVTFVDIREDIDKSVGAGLGYSSDVVEKAYKSKSTNAYKQQYSVQAFIKGWD